MVSKNTSLSSFLGSTITSVLSAHQVHWGGQRWKGMVVSLWELIISHRNQAHTYLKHSKVYTVKLQIKLSGSTRKKEKFGLKSIWGRFLEESGSSGADGWLWWVEKSRVAKFSSLQSPVNRNILDFLLFSYEFPATAWF